MHLTISASCGEGRKSFHRPALGSQAAPLDSVSDCSDVAVWSPLQGAMDMVGSHRRRMSFPLTNSDASWTSRALWGAGTGKDAIVKAQEEADRWKRISVWEKLETGLHEIC